jgi:predicted MFS family arabinose efflux permease
MPKEMDVHLKLKNSALAMIGLGVGELFGSFINGAIIDRISHRNALIICVLEAVTVFTLVIMFAQKDDFNFLFTFLTCVTFGF